MRYFLGRCSPASDEQGDPIEGANRHILGPEPPRVRPFFSPLFTEVRRRDVLRSSSPRICHLAHKMGHLADALASTYLHTYPQQ